MTDDFGEVWFATSAGRLEPGDLVLEPEEEMLVGLHRGGFKPTLAMNLWMIAETVGMDDLRAPEFESVLGTLRRIAATRSEQGREGERE